MPQNILNLVSGWPILTGHNVKGGSFAGWTVIVFEHTGIPVMKSRSVIGEISSAIIGYDQITDDHKASVRERIARHFRLSRRDAVFVFDSRGDIQQDLNAAILQHEIEMGLCPMRIFLSHKGADKPMVREFKRTLEELGFDPWLDEDAAAGVELERAILQGFKDSCAAVFFVTPNFQDEQYLSTEVNYAIQEKRAKGERFSIVTIVFSEGPNKGVVPDLLKQYVWKEPNSQVEAFREIIRAIPIKVGPVQSNMEHNQNKNPVLSEHHKVAQFSDANDLALKGSANISGTVQSLPWEGKISQRLRNDIASLHISIEIQQSIYDVLMYREYPKWMSIQGRLVRNPVWTGKDCRQIINEYPLDRNAPQVMHLDMLLIRRNDDGGRGLIYTYSSPTWGTHLIPFRKWHSEDRLVRSELNAKNLARYLTVPADFIAVTSMPGKYAVSVKQRAKYNDLIIYIYEFCSVKFINLPDSLSCRESEYTHKKGPIIQGTWFYMQTLRTDKTAFSLNGDVIFALHDLFEDHLGTLPCSLSE
ncbi:MAG: hypothetical protein DDT33_01325 [Firmicutes bacterium]|nr:hypothetical protein [Bacillota bacterium]